MCIVKPIFMVPLSPDSMEGFLASDLRSLLKEIANRRIKKSKVKISESDSDEDELDYMFLGFTEEQIENSRQKLKKRKKLLLNDELKDKRIRTCSVDLSRSELIIKDIYVASHCHNCNVVKSDLSIPINFSQNQIIDSNSSQVKFKKIVLKVFGEQCYISVSIPENFTICTGCKVKKNSLSD